MLVVETARYLLQLNQEQVRKGGRGGGRGERAVCLLRLNQMGEGTKKEEACHYSPVGSNGL